MAQRKGRDLPKKPAKPGASGGSLGGRPTKFTPENRAKVLKHLRAGQGRLGASRRARLHYNTVLAWIQRGEAEWDRLEAEPDALVRAEESDYLDFAIDVAEAEAEWEGGAIEELNVAGPQWRAWQLARRNRKEWGDKVEVEQAGQLTVRVVYTDEEGPAGAAGDGSE